MLFARLAGGVRNGLCDEHARIGESGRGKDEEKGAHTPSIAAGDNSERENSCASELQFKSLSHPSYRFESVRL